MSSLKSSTSLFLKENKSYLLIIVIIGYLVYFNSLFNGFVLDDLFQIANNPNIIGWDKLFYFFSHEIGPYYRPLMITTFSFFHNLSLPSFFYHFFQVTIHIANAGLVFLLLETFLNRKKLSLFLSMVFLVHPINVEVVVYASQLQETYFMFFGLLGLLLVKNGLSNKKLVITLTILQLLSLLSKETAILFIVTQIIFTYLFQRRYLVKQLIISTLSVSLYFAWRLALFGSISAHKFQIEIPNSPSTSTFVERLINIPSIIFFYLRTFLFPNDLAVSQLWWNKTIDIDNFYLPLSINLSALLLLVILGIYIYKKHVKNFKLFLFFAIWILAGLGLHGQIIPLDWTVAERWFYFPIIGLLGLIGLGLKGIEFKREETKTIVVIFAIILVILLSFRTIIRNANWYSQLTLTSHDIRMSKDSGDLELNLGLALTEAGRHEEAIKHLKKATELIPEGFTVWDGLGATYGNAKQYDKAIISFRKAVNFNKDYYLAYSHLAYIYLLDLKADEARKFLENEALKKWPSDAYFWRLLGFANVLRKDKDSALKAFEKAYNLSPDELNTYYYLNLKDGKEVILRM